MKIKKILSGILTAAMLLGSVTANAVTIESDDAPKRSGAVIEQGSSGDEEIVDKSVYGLPDNIEDGAILHAWSWSFDTIYNAIPAIAAAGYTAVQTSPASKCYDIGDVHGLNESDYDFLMGTTRRDIFGIDGNNFNGSGGAWWWYYQPVKLEVGNYALGTREQYQRMCERAHKYGVKIILSDIPHLNI